MTKLEENMSKIKEQIHISEKESYMTTKREPSFLKFLLQHSLLLIETKTVLKSVFLSLEMAFLFIFHKMLSDRKSPSSNLYCLYSEAPCVLLFTYPDRVTGELSRIKPGQ